MKTILLIIIAFVMSTSLSQAQTNQKKTFSLSVDLSRLKVIDSQIYLVYYKKALSGLETIKDSAIVKKGVAKFDGFTEEPLVAILWSKMSNNGIKFCLSPGNVNINVGLIWGDYNVTGSVYQQDFEMMSNMQGQYQKRLNVIGEQIRTYGMAKDSANLAKYRAEFDKVSGQMYDSVFKAYVVTHAKTSALSVFALNIYASIKMGLVSDSLYNLLSPSFQKLPTAVLLKKEIDQFNRIMIGHPAPLFSQKDASGKLINLVSLRGKYVLIDFWASWCNPCRAEHPSLVKIYEKYHSKAFDILGVSLDSESSKNSWLKAIQDDHIALWAQVSDLKGWDNGVCKQYSIKYIPQNYLINPNGIIVAKNLNMEELDKKLSELL